MINLSKITLAYGERLLFDNISCSFGDEKIGLVGRNGAGKSTLLKVIAKEIKPDTGAIATRRDMRIAYLPQEVTFSSERTVFDEACLSVAELALDEKVKVLEKKAAHDASFIDEYLQVKQLAQASDRYQLEKKVREMLCGLGFNQKMQDGPVQALSVGWRMRLLLAKLLLQNADFYLFDEPTNHLDIAGKEWFIDFLRSFSGGFLLVTHDRFFLDKVCNKIAEVERGHLHVFDGNFTDYVQKKEDILAVQRSAQARQQREIERKEATINRFKASASKARQMQSMMKQLDRIERIEVEPLLPTINVQLLPVVKSSSIVLTLKNIAYGYDERQLFRNVNLEIARGQKVALVAPNGMGKTTLFNIIAGLLKPQTGTVIFGQYVTSALFAQDQSRVLKAGNTIFEEISQATDVPDRIVRAFLGSFLFPGDDAYKKISMLSGGERNRVAMVKVFLQKANLLLLDEPTNHLDLCAKEILAQALQKFEGTIFFVSHDQDFINKVATRIVELMPTGLLSYDGSYESYLFYKKQQYGQSLPEQSNAVSVQLMPKKKQKDASAHKRLQWLERRIEQVEKDIALKTQKLLTYQFHDPLYQQYAEEIKTMEKELATLNDEWQKLYE